MLFNFVRRFYDVAPPTGGGSGTNEDVAFTEAINKSIKGLSESAQKNFKEIADKMASMNENGATKADFKTLEELIKKNEKDLATVNEFAENLQKELKGKNLTNPAAGELFVNQVGDLIEKNYKEILAGRGSNVPMTFDMKDASLTRKDMSFDGNTTGMVVAPDFNPNIIGPPFQVPHLRSLVRIGQTSGQAYYFPVAKLKSGEVGSVQPGAQKPEIQYQIDGKVAQVIKLAAWLRLPDEMLEDILGLTSFLQNYMPEEVYKAEDRQILRGDGTTGNFDGLMHQARTYVPSTGVDASESWDVLADGIAQQAKIWLPSTSVLVDPIRWMFMATRKGTTKDYSYPTLILGAPLTVAGNRILPHPIMNSDEFLLGNFSLAEMKMRTGMSLRFYDQDRDNAIKNMTTVVVEERAAFAVYYPDAFLKGTFGAS